MTNNYYKLDKLLSYNSMLNMVIGARGVGKTFAVKKYMLEQAINKKSKSIYLRRRDSELLGIDKEKFFPTEILKQVFTNFEEIETKNSRAETAIKFFGNGRENELKINSKRIILNDIVIIYLKSLSTSIKLKGSEYDEVDTVLFDEFLIDEMDKNLRYLPNEVDLLFQFMSSVFRKRDKVKVFMLANATNTNNPYFAYFRFDYNDYNTKEYNYLKKYGVVVHIAPNKPVDFSKESLNDNPLLKIMQDSQIFKSNVENEFTVNNYSNVKKIKGRKTKLYQIDCGNNQIYSIFQKGSIIYIDNSYEKNLNNITFNKNLISDTSIYLDRSNYISKMLRDKFYKNDIIYCNFEVKYNVMEELNSII